MKIIDRIIDRAVKKHLANASRMYAAARPSRLTSGWSTPTSSADSEIRTSMTQLRARSRALVRDASYAKRARGIIVDNVIGTGIGMQGQVRSVRKKLMTRINDAIESTWQKWSRPEFCHVGGALHFSDLERLLMGEVFEAGEVFVRIHRSEFGGSGIPYALEVIESERVPHDDLQGISATVGNEVRMGIEVDWYYRPIAYWIRDRHPSEFMYPSVGDSERVRRVPADEIIHLRLIDRWPQVRGVPWVHAAATKLNDMNNYSESEIVGARAAANFVGAYDGTTDLYGDADRQDDGTYQTELEPGIILNPPPGKKFTLFSPSRPNSAFDPFMRYMLREVASGTGVSYESLSRDYSQSNYSSSRLALLDDRDLWRVLQSWFIRSFRMRVHCTWLAQAMYAKAVPTVSPAEYMTNVDKFEAVKFKPRGWSWVDPTKEVAAYKEAIKAGLTTRSKVIAATGGGDDIEDIDDERRQELDAAAEKGLTFDTDPVAAVDDQDDETDDDQDDDDNETKLSQKMRAVK